MEDILIKLQEIVFNILDTINVFLYKYIYIGIIVKLKKIKKEELFILMLVAGVILAAIIPTVKLLIKSSVPKNGIFKCYYNEDGILMQENSGDKKYKTPQPAKNGVCTFRMADDTKKLYITIIGGGGGGSASQIAQNQRNIEFNPISEEIDLLSDEIEIENPFDKNYVSDVRFNEEFLNKISISVAGGGGGSYSNSDESSGMGGICTIKQGMIKVGDVISRKSGKNGINGSNGTNGKMSYKKADGNSFELVAYGGKSASNADNSNRKNGECSDKSFSGGYYRNESIKGSTPTQTENQAFYNNFLISKIVAQSQKEKIKVIKGLSGMAGETITFNAGSLKGLLKICGQDSKEKCHAYIGKGGVGGQIKNKNSSIYGENLSGKNGGDTKFLNKIAKGGLGADGNPKNISYLTDKELSTNGEDGMTTDGKFIQNTGGNCAKTNCEAKNTTELGASGGGGGLQYITSIPFRQNLVVKAVDNQERQIGNTVKFMEEVEADTTNDIRNMGNGGNGGSGAIIIRW